MSLPRNVLFWHKLYECLGAFLTNRWLRIYGVIIGTLALYGWGIYIPYTGGLLPGYHWAAVVYDIAFPHIGFGMLLGVMFGWKVVVISILYLLIISFVPGWQRIRRIVASLCCFVVIWLFSLLAIAPALGISYSYRNALTVKPWGKTYRSAYVAFRLDDNYGDVMLSECNRLDWCYKLHRRHTDFYSAQQAQLTYDVANDRLKVPINPGGYIRSRDQQLCPEEGSKVDNCFYDY